MKITPLRDYVLILQDNGEQQTESGLFISTDVRQLKGEVINIGPQVEDLKIGDVVGYQAQTYPHFQKESEEYLVIPESNITIKYA